jgi:hypothetical protein
MRFYTSDPQVFVVTLIGLTIGEYVSGYQKEWSILTRADLWVLLREHMLLYYWELIRRVGGAGTLLNYVLLAQCSTVPARRLRTADATARWSAPVRACPITVPCVQ